MENKLARLVYPAYRFWQNDIDYAYKLVDLGVGGFCIYGGTSPQIKDFTSKIRKKAQRPLLICADYEDGLGRWVKDFPELMSNMAIGASGAEDIAFTKGRITAKQAKSLGVDWILAPVADMSNRPDNPIVNVRSFSDNTALASKLITAFIKGIHVEKSVCCIKHFPGHGDTEKDSHLSLPLITKTEQSLVEYELVPFRKNAAIADALMTGHLLIKEIDKDYPASFSKKIIGELLRKKIGFKVVLLPTHSQ